MTMKTQLLRAFAAIPLLLVALSAPLAAEYAERAAPALLRTLPPLKLLDAKAFSVTLEFPGEPCSRSRGVRPLTLLSAPADLAMPRGRPGIEACRV